MKRKQEVIPKVSKILYRGAGRAISSRVLCDLLEMDPRQLTITIEKERRAGYPICASSDANAPGYYLAATPEEMADYCERLRHRAGEIQKTRKACLKAMARMSADEIYIATPTQATAGQLHIYDYILQAEKVNV